MRDSAGIRLSAGNFTVDAKMRTIAPAWLRGRDRREAAIDGKHNIDEAAVLPAGSKLRRNAAGREKRTGSGSRGR
jgi:hypothetical protein